MLQVSLPPSRAVLLAMIALLSACGTSDGAPIGGAPPLASNYAARTWSVATVDTGSLTYYRAPAQAPYTGNNYILGPSNSIWYVSGSASSANRITEFISPTKKKTITLPSVCHTSGKFVPAGLANGADGRVWFGSLCGGIGAVNSSGGIQVYGSPPNCAGFGCSTQLDAVSGNQIWFTSIIPGKKNNLSVGYIDTATSSFKLYGVDTKNASLSEIVQGPDGNFWFGVDSEIGRVTPQGSVTLFRTQPKMFNVSILLFGSDGALWFFNGEGGTVGRMSTAGAMLSEKAIPDTANAAVLGANGNVWFTTAAKSGRSSLVEMTSAKTYTIIKTDKKYKSCVMDGLANGPDGNLWFGNYAAQTQCGYGVGSLTASGENRH